MKELINPLPNDKILDLPTLEALQRDKINATIPDYLSPEGRKHCGKIAIFPYLTQCFQVNSFKKKMPFDQYLHCKMNDFFFCIACNVYSQLDFSLAAFRSQQTKSKF